MGWLFDVDWANTFRLETPLLEIVLRGSLVYLGLFVMLRVVLKREAGTVGITDLLVIVLLADAAQNALADDYTSIPDGLLLVATILFWSFALDWLGYRSPRLRRFVRPEPLPLVRDGRLLRGNMRKELITEEELLGAIRLQGVDDLAEVRAAYMEADGRISVVTDERRGGEAPERPAR